MYLAPDRPRSNGAHPRAGRSGQPLHTLPAACQDQEQTLLVIEIPVVGALRHTGAASDISHSRVLVAEL